jgi:hypothetical protein
MSDDEQHAEKQDKHYEDTQHKRFIDKVIDRLFTSEDKHYLHKTLGLLAVLNFLYRYFYVFPTTGSLGYEESNLFNHATMFVHFMLSSSSLIFHVIKKRLPRKPLIIYKEYQIHAILFTARACAPYVLQHFNMLDMYPVIILAVHLLVDHVTRVYGTPGVTAVRVRNNSKKKFIRYTRLFFSFYQIMALASHLGNRELSNMGFNALIAIQSSAFLMTLHRKGIISWRPYLFWYGFALVLSYFVMLRVEPWYFLPICLACFAIRVQGVSKYIIWAVYYLGVHHQDQVLGLLNSANLAPEAVLTRLTSSSSA